MIGRVRFALDGRDYVAELGDDRLWHCPDLPALETALNVGFDVEDGPQYGFLGHAAVTGAAVWLGGRAELPPRPDLPAGVDF